MVIPDDIAFVGFSESQKALIIEPNLTSVEQPTFEMGKVTAELLLEQIKIIQMKQNLQKQLSWTLNLILENRL
jgi:transcriptional regulator, LacI family